MMWPFSFAQEAAELKQSMTLLEYALDWVGTLRDCMCIHVS